jgi:TPR repeat protein
MRTARSVALASLRGVGIQQDRIDAYQWMSLAATQGQEEARVYLPAVEGTLTADELERAKANVAQFRPKERKGERRPSKKELLKVVGLNKAPGEYERFFGMGGGVDR